MSATFPPGSRLLLLAVVKEREMDMKRFAGLHGNCLRVALVFTILGGSAAIASAQYGSGGVPPRDAGYSAFYHDQDDDPNYAAHWGFHDGLADGSHDRETGHSFRPTHDAAYKHAPEYGHPPIGRDEYKNIYREAYVHGYEKGYGR